MRRVTCGVAGNTSDSGSEESRFEPWQVNQKKSLEIVQAFVLITMRKLLILLNVFVLSPAILFSQEKGLRLKLEKAPKFKFIEFADQKDTISLSGEEMKLYLLINDYRQLANKPEIPLSKSLTYVAKLHAQDLKFNVKEGNRCNLHSWSKKGPWSACCYSPDHSKAGCMWNKPRELTTYPFNGYEIVYFHSWDPSAEDAFNHWIDSEIHRPVILNTDAWKDQDWQAIGIGIYQEYAVVWFGKKPDHEGSPRVPTN